MRGVGRVEAGGMRHLFPQPSTGMVISPPSTSPPADSTDSNSTAEEAVCAESDGKLGPDSDLGQRSEGIPYGIKLVQADDPAMVHLSRKYRSKVLFCVIDTGLDRTNQEFNNATTSGCMPGFPDGDTSQPFRYCYNWYEDANRHGTHTSGTIGALRNGRGVVGVSSEGAQVYHYNYFGPNMAASDDLEVAAWQECIAELDRRKLATSTPDMKLVISMSYGSTSVTDFSKAAIAALAKARNDVLWIAAAGNGGDNTTNYPAGYDEVISIGAVDWNSKPAAFSTYNDDVELSAPGVQTLSTIPVAMTNSSGYAALPFSLLANDTDFFNKPKVARVDGSPAGTVTGSLMDCGLASEKCEAAGSLCLIQRGETTFCEKLLNCAAGGGIGAIIYNRDDLPDCERLAGVSVEICDSSPDKGWAPAISVSRRQGRALREALAAGEAVSATIRITEVQGQNPYSLDLLSGTSMATPTASGVAGLVWSAHTQCTAAEIRAVLRKTATKPANATAGRDQKYGFGIVQAVAAHTYLEANPCTASSVKVTLRCTVPNANTAAGPVVGGRLQVSVQVQDKATGRPAIGQRVLLTLEPSRKAVACKSYSLTTNKRAQQ
ncbi:peptidase S8/S53 domain-containing protein [Scenedesmus sp. NREL 46B-D3]|nr:peptidase S8/S53 domain-containing protein [Scenedesmus sp. NREL 46B-D3]